MITNSYTNSANMLSPEVHQKAITALFNVCIGTGSLSHCLTLTLTLLSINQSQPQLKLQLSSPIQKLQLQSQGLMLDFPRPTAFLGSFLLLCFETTGLIGNKSIAIDNQVATSKGGSQYMFILSVCLNCRAHISTFFSTTRFSKWGLVTMVLFKAS
jgi:hypothetical protein